MAITVLDTTDSAIMRLIVDDPDKARELMVNNDFPYTECDVLAVEITDESDLKRRPRRAARGRDQHPLHLQLHQTPRGQVRARDQCRGRRRRRAIARTHGFKVLTQRDISR